MLMKVSLPTFLLIMLIFYGLIALLFSFLFLPDLSSITPPMASFWDIFLFHIEFLTGLGGLHNGRSNYLQIVLSLESLVKVLAFSIITGLIFIRFTRPVARIRFSKKALITNNLGQRQFMFRAMHERQDALVNLHTELSLSILEKLPEGTGYWKSFHGLPLRRSGLPAFSLPWNVMHVIDKDSKLFPMHSVEDLQEASATVYVVLNASDQITGGSVHAMHSYRACDIVFGRRFDDVIIINPDGTRFCDMAKFDLLKAD